ncbi:MAG: serine/threonine-protein phosphatase [Leptospirales bacterium]|nr:serine/threonine-protein phosphatase [Leptospirales bacterium]
MSDSRDLWHESPSAEVLLENGCISALNAAAGNLLGLTEKDLNVETWEDRVFDERNKKKFQNFLKGIAGISSGLEVKAASGEIRFVRFLKKALPGGTILLSLQDLTESREDAQAFQAGYDEFIRVTTDLEDALGTIEKQNKLLERQKQILESELQIAHLVQAQLLSQDFGRHSLVQIAGVYQAMAELGGDMWEFYESESEIWAAIGDVMGHGVASSLISIAAKSLFKRRFEEASAVGKSLARLSLALNQEMVEITNSNYFLTACVVRIDQHHRMDYLTAGHPPLLHIPADRKKPVNLLFTEQPMLGVFRDIQYVSESVQLELHDRIFLYTDCLVESVNDRGEVINLLDVGDRLRWREGTSASTVIEDMLEFRRDFAGSDQLPDDLTMICIEIPDKAGTTAGRSRS